jgi:hypothetical protein
MNTAFCQRPLRRQQWFSQTDEIVPAPKPWHARPPATAFPAGKSWTT